MSRWASPWASPRLRSPFSFGTPWNYSPAISRTHCHAPGLNLSPNLSSPTRGIAAKRGKKIKCPSTSNKADRKKELDYQVRHVLTEARMVLPGAQALLGFQFVTFVLTDFDKLPQSSRLVHLASLLMMGISTILLMTPAAFHRLAEHGRNTESFTRFASHILIAALVPLALGICGDLFVIVRKTTNSATIGIAVTLAILAFSYALWFAYPIYRRRSAA